MSTFATGLTLSASAQVEKSDWLADHSTLIVGVAGIVFSGFVGPTVTALFMGRREQAKDRRAVSVARANELLGVLDEIARVLGDAVRQLRPLLNAQQAGNPLPDGPVDFLSSLSPLGKRLRLRVPGDHELIDLYDRAVGALNALETKIGSQKDWDAGVEEFEGARAEFLDAGRRAVEERLAKGESS